MRIFLSYAHEQLAVAERLAASLREAGDNVFRDHDRLRGGEAFDERIADEIASTHLFLFLLSPDSVGKGYARSELEMARKRWKRLSRHVLPVEVVPVSQEDLPGFLNVLNIVRTKGDLVADVLAEVSVVRRARTRRLAMRGAVAAIAIAAALAVASRTRSSHGAIPHRPLCLLSAEIKLPDPPADPLPALARIVVTDSSGAANGYPVSTLGPVPFQVAVQGEEEWTIDVLDLPHVWFRGVRVRGCPTNAKEIPGAKASVLVLRPR